MSFDDDLQAAQSRRDAPMPPREVFMYEGQIADIDLDVSALIVAGDRSRLSARRVRNLLDRRADLCRRIEDLGFDPPELNPALWRRG